jgi:hypothetical protein
LGVALLNRSLALQPSSVRAGRLDLRALVLAQATE